MSPYHLLSNVRFCRVPLNMCYFYNDTTFKGAGKSMVYQIKRLIKLRCVLSSRKLYLQLLPFLIKFIKLANSN